MKKNCKTTIDVKQNNDSDECDSNSSKERIVKFVVVTVEAIVGLLIAVSIQSFAFICNLAGSICTLQMTVVFPCVMYIIFILRVEQKKIDYYGYVKIGITITVVIIMVILALWNLVSLMYLGPNAT